MTTRSPEEVWAEVVRHLPLVRLVARDFAASGLDRDDLVQLGTFGLKRAVERHDATLGFEFSSFACTCIRNAIVDATRSGAARRLLPLDGEADRIEARPDRLDPDALADALAALDRLDPRSRSVVSRTFGLAGPRATHDQLALEMGLCRGYVSRIYRAAVAELRGSVA